MFYAFKVGKKEATRDVGMRSDSWKEGLVFDANDAVWLFDFHLTRKARIGRTRTGKNLF